MLSALVVESFDKNQMATKSGLKPTVSETAPINSVNRKLAIQALEPRIPFTVAIWFLSKDSTTSALNMQEITWWPKPPMEISAIAM